MRRAWSLLLIALTGCGDRRSFDERYDGAADQIEQRAANLDAQAEDVPTQTAGVNAGAAAN